MFCRGMLISALTITMFNSFPVFAKVIEVKMLNRGLEGAMVFEPSYIKADVGDEIKFIAIDKGHNVESIKNMLPPQIKPFKSPMNKDYSLTLEAAGFYGLKCTPHYGMGMVALLEVGDVSSSANSAGVKHPGKAKKRFIKLWDLAEK